MMRRIAIATKKVVGRSVSYLKKAAPISVGLISKIKYVKTYAKAGMIDALYAIPYKDACSQTLFVNSNKWDYLIILDACRYDTFEKYVWKYLDGKLLRAWSPGGYTVKWFRRTWTKIYKDVVYISSVPFIKRKDIKIRRKFLRIVDAWDIGWDEKVYTVPPWNMNKIVLQEIKFTKIRRKLGKYPSRVRFVIHYVQPHAPYLAGPINFSKLYELYLGEIKDKVGIVPEHAILLHLFNVLKDTKKVNEALRREYEENLKLVLKFVAEIIPYLQGKIVITSDHGELLGEYGLYFHPIDALIPELRCVPLFIVK